MSKKIFINLPVQDLSASMAFYTAAGFSNNPAFTDETAACMVYSDTIMLMLLTHPRFTGFTERPLGNHGTATSSILSLSMESPEAVNALMEKLLEAGAREPVAGRDYGFMQQRSFLDPDGHYWEVFYYDESKLPL